MCRGRTAKVRRTPSTSKVGTRWLGNGAGCKAQGHPSFPHPPSSILWRTNVRACTQPFLYWDISEGPGYLVAPCRRNRKPAKRISKGGGDAFSARALQEPMSSREHLGPTLHSVGALSDTCNARINFVERPSRNVRLATLPDSRTDRPHRPLPLSYGRRGSMARAPVPSREKKQNAVRVCGPLFQRPPWKIRRIGLRERL
ncbi:unnamed protein product [Ixodes persulcatus]